MNFIHSILKQSKPKKCKQCLKEFIPYNSLQKVCSPKCASELASKKVWEKEKKAIKEKSRTRTEWLNLAQVVFNTYINKRDYGKPCISCGCDLTGKKVNASHYLPVGSYPALRFDEDNCHSSCIECNLYKHGNQLEYTIRLPKRIGEDRFNALLEKRNTILKINQTEIQQLIQFYKNKIKEYKK